MSEVPDVSVLLPVRNEAEHIDDVLGDLLGQDFVGELEIIVADGRSDDGTAEKAMAWASRDPRIRLVTNDEGHQAPGLNLAAAHARARLLLRADGHTRYANDFVDASVSAQSELGGAVGGPMSPVGPTRFARAVAAAMNSRYTMGPGRFHHATDREEVDTVYLGCFPKADFDALGGFRRFPSGSSEDADFYYRWTRSGRKVYVDPAIRSFYSPRSNLKSLFRQYWRYGQGKAEMFWANGRLPSWRPLAPAALIVGLLAGVPLWIFFGQVWPIVALLVAWLGLLAWVGRRSDEEVLLVVVVAMTMHLSYGLGFVYGFWSVVVSKLLRIPRLSSSRS